MACKFKRKVHEEKLRCITVRWKLKRYNWKFRNSDGKSNYLGNKKRKRMFKSFFREMALCSDCYMKKYDGAKSENDENDNYVIIVHALLIWCCEEGSCFQNWCLKYIHSSTLCRFTAVLESKMEVDIERLHLWFLALYAESLEVNSPDLHTKMIDLAVNFPICCSEHTIPLLYFSRFCVQCVFNAGCTAPVPKIVHYNCRLPAECLIWSQLNSVSVPVARPKFSRERVAFFQTAFSDSKSSAGYLQFHFI